MNYYLIFDWSSSIYPYYIFLVLYHLIPKNILIASKNTPATMIPIRAPIPSPLLSGLGTSNVGKTYNVTSLSSLVRSEKIDIRMMQVDVEHLLRSSLVNKLTPWLSDILRSLTPAIPSIFLGKEHYYSVEQITYFPVTV